ncbi:MAG: tRNA lysidine(34) synthetase TilS [Muribaculaceae bacterium]|nr:tRNA lysidine(34) synthetase TilS [Muribaculaceae bacterium]
METKQFEQRVAEYVAAHRMVGSNGAVLVALSGGADSVALLRVLLSMGIDCEAAHCNFHLRGEESMRDERFVRELCESLNVPLHVRDFDVEAYRRTHGVSVEMACRTLRYEWFGQLLADGNCAVVAVAHHRDDNVETFFLNALRGTGLAGLAGMRPVHGRVIRPLLCVCRADALEYLQGLGQGFVTDSTNMENDYLRNRLRNVVIPAVEQEFPAARDRISDTMNRVGEGRALYAELVERLRSEALMASPHAGVARYNLSVLRQVENRGILLYEMLKKDGFNRTQCEAVFTASVGCVFSSSTRTLYVGRDFIDIEESTIDSIEEISISLSNPNSFPDWLRMNRSAVPFAPSMVDGRNTVALHPDVLSCGRVVLRHWRKGDRLSPYGMHGSKLVSDLFADAKLSDADKKAVWLLEADGCVVWVLGLRASSHLKVELGSTDYLLLHYCSC